MPPSTVRNSWIGDPPRIFGIWPMATLIPMPVMYPTSNGRDRNSDRNPSAASRIRDEDQGDQQGQGRLPSGCGRRTATARGAMGRPAEGRGRRVRADDEPPGRAEDGIGQQRHERGIEAGLGRQSGDLGVADAQRHDQGRHRQPADAVLAELVAAIAAQRPRQRRARLGQTSGQTRSERGEALAQSAAGQSSRDQLGVRRPGLRRAGLRPSPAPPRSGAGSGRRLGPELDAEASSQRRICR